MQQQKTRSASFLLVMSWIYLVLALGMIGLALYNLTRPDIRLTFAGVTDAVFLIIGGVLGHQIGGGRGQDIATGVGAVGGAVVGANVGKNYGSAPRYATREVRRCENVVSGRPAYWDVTYYFRGTYHRAQLTAAPGPTIVVNGRGEPRL